MTAKCNVLFQLGPGAEGGHEWQNWWNLNKVWSLVNSNVSVLAGLFYKCTVGMWDVNNEGNWVKDGNSPCDLCNLPVYLKLF